MNLGDMVLITKRGLPWSGMAGPIVEISPGSKNAWYTVEIRGKKLLFDESEIRPVSNSKTE